jgi:hypothetical protein
MRPATVVDGKVVIFEGGQVHVLSRYEKLLWSLGKLKAVKR